MVSVFLGGEAPTVIRQNEASENGGGLFGFSSYATLTIDLGHTLLLEDNFCKLDGGGVALTQGAQMTVTSAKCPSTCPGVLRKNGVCNLQCMTAGCNWDDGDCRFVFEEAGPDSLISCNVATNLYIPTVQHAHCLTVPKNKGDALGYTFTASCNWTPFRRVLVCEEARKELGKCPTWDAIAYQSVRSTPGVIYVKEDKGFTTPNFYTTKDMEPFGQQGVGRCLDTTMNTCRTDAPPPRGDAALPIEPGESWCDTLADFG